MNKNHCKQENIRLGTHGEDYGSWMSNPVFYIIGGIGVLGRCAGCPLFLMYYMSLFLVFCLLYHNRNFGFADLDHMDQAAVCLWRWRNYGTGSSSRSLSSGL